MKPGPQPVCPVDKGTGLALLAFFNALRLMMREREVTFNHDLYANLHDNEKWIVQAIGGGWTVSMQVSPDLRCSLYVRETNSNCATFTYSNIADPKLLPKIIGLLNSQTKWGISLEEVEALVKTDEAQASLRAAAFTYWYTDNGSLPASI